MALAGGQKQYLKISKKGRFGDLLTSSDLIMDLICTNDPSSDRAPSYQHFEGSHDPLSSRARTVDGFLFSQPQIFGHFLRPHSQHKRVNKKNCSRVTGGHPPEKVRPIPSLQESAKKKTLTLSARFDPSAPGLLVMI